MKHLDHRTQILLREEMLNGVTDTDPGYIYAYEVLGTVCVSVPRDDTHITQITTTQASSR